jgi:acid ceramidase
MRARTSGIQLVDIDLDSTDGWSVGLKPVAAGGGQLVRAFNTQGRGVVGGPAWFALQRATGALHSLLGGHLGAEIDDIAEGLRVPAREVVLANAAYDIAGVGCSTIVAATADGPLHARNLDWTFPRNLLKKHLTVARMRNGPHGDYALVTWPGMFGALTGIAPGRFSITVNFVQHDEDSGLLQLAKRAIGGHWPVAWVVRRALDEAKNFKAAVKMIQNEYVLSPVLITVVGTENDERVCIECGCDDYALRRPGADGPLIVTNHYQTDELEEHNVDLDELDTCERYAALEELLAGKKVTSRGALAALSNDDVISSDTQHQVVMEPASGRLTVRIPGGPSLSLVV